MLLELLLLSPPSPNALLEVLLMLLDLSPKVFPLLETALLPAETLLLLTSDLALLNWLLGS